MISYINMLLVLITYIAMFVAKCLIGIQNSTGNMPSKLQSAI